MEIEKPTKSIAIIGGGPSGLFMYKRLVESANTGMEIHIFERKHQLGAGMPYSHEGANMEHITNVSGNEIPQIVIPVEEWIQTLPAAKLAGFGIDKARYNDYKVLPRLLFGEYLSAQFEMLEKIAAAAGVKTTIHPDCPVSDIADDRETEQIKIAFDGTAMAFDAAIICTGHHWPKKCEGRIPGYFDSPYPPAKLAMHCNHSVAIKGSSLTAIDAIRTLARHNGTFTHNAHGKYIYVPSSKSPGFKMVMHSRSGLLPAVRFHLEDSHLQNDSLLTPEEIAAHKTENDGFLSLDFIFEKDFKRIFLEKDPEFYSRIKDMDIEAFVESMMALRERLDPFVLLKAEYAEAEQSIRRHESVYWKEMLAVLSFAMNYPAKYFSAEDMLRLQKVLMPLISIVIAFVPQASCRDLMALHEAGALDIVAVGQDSGIEAIAAGGVKYHYMEDGKKRSVFYRTFVDAVGQPHLSYADFPFESLRLSKSISPARLQFRLAEKGIEEKNKGNKEVTNDGCGNYYLNVPGITINDHFQLLDQYGAYSDRLYMMAVPYMSGFNPDYSGLDFCEEASKRIVDKVTDFFQ